MTTYTDFHRRSLTDRAGFWREEAALIDWQTPFGEVLDYAKPPFAHWFVGGRTNLCHNAVDRHLATRGCAAARRFTTSRWSTTRSASHATRRPRSSSSTGISTARCRERPDATWITRRCAPNR